jgi:pepF/M3 family oligoendopeptidase
MSNNAKITPAPRWDIESIFAGGSASEEFKQHRDNVVRDLNHAEKQLNNIQFDIDDSTFDNWIEFIQLLQSLFMDIELIFSFSGCLTAQDNTDSAADAMTSEAYLYFSRWEKLRTVLESRAMAQSDENWNRLISDERLNEISFYLNELRDLAKLKMPVEMESLGLELAVNGYHGWNQLYEKMSGELTVQFESDGKVETLSLGQLATKMANPDRAIRQQAFEKMVGAWKNREDLAAMMLNFMGGFRLSLYDRRGWESPLLEPLMNSRMKQESLDTMWSVIRENSHRLKPYIEAKKKLLGIDKFRWYDQVAPCGKADKLYSFEEAGQFIIDNVKELSPDVAEFVKMALDKNWVEAEDRPGKRGGAFCTGLGKLNQTRVFMTYSGTYDSLLTLAHELGHSYHSWVLNSKPGFAREYPMNLAETASNFFETLVTDAALAQATDPSEKLMLIEQKLQAAYAMFTDLQSRYLFDSSFYAARKNGMLSKDELNNLMINAQKDAFGDLLDESGYHPLFWCTKLHFFITDAPFYNFPYTFGFLFAGGVYALSKKEGATFAEKYDALLTDTGSMTTEDVAKKHLGVDLTQPDFWKEAVDTALADVDEFVKLVDELVK